MTTKNLSDAAHEVLQPTGLTYFQCDSFVGRIFGDFNPSQPYQTYKLTNPITGESRVLAAMHLKPVTEAIAVARLNVLAIELDRQRALQASKGGKPQCFVKDCKSLATLAAQVIAYLTSAPVLIEQRSTSLDWVIYSDVEFEVALFILRLDETPPLVTPEWWGTAANYHFRDKVFDDTFMLASKASKLHYFRNPGDDPTIGNQPNAWATAISDELQAREDAEERAIQLQLSDPNFIVDRRHVARAEFEQSLVDAEVDQVDYSGALSDWDQRNPT